MVPERDTAGSDPLPAEATDLYGLALDDFTSARNDLARSLLDRGMVAESKLVKALKKPSLAAWAVNQVARSQNENVSALLGITDRIKEAEDPTEMREAVGERHRLVKDLVKVAARLLDEGGHSAGASTLGQVTATLYAAGAENDGGRIVRGTLDRPIQGSGFDTASGLSLESMVSEQPAAEEDPEKVRLAAELQEAEERAAELDQEAAKARLAADTADSEAAQARRRVIQLRDRLGRIGG